MDFPVSRIGASMINEYKMRLINHAGYVEARYMRGGLDDQSIFVETHVQPSYLPSRSFIVAQYL